MNQIHNHNLFITYQWFMINLCIPEKSSSAIQVSRRSQKVDNLPMYGYSKKKNNNIIVLVKQVTSLQDKLKFLEQFTELHL